MDKGQPKNLTLEFYTTKNIDLFARDEQPDYSFTFSLSTDSSPKILKVGAMKNSFDN